MRTAALLLLTLASLAPSASAQVAPDTVIVERVRVAEAPSDSSMPVGVQLLGGALGGASGVYVGLQLGDPLDLPGAMYPLIGSALGTALLVTATGDRDAFWRTLAGATIGTVGGLALASVLSGHVGDVEQALMIGLPVGATIGATLAN